GQTAYHPISRGRSSSTATGVPSAFFETRALASVTTRPCSSVTTKSTPGSRRVSSGSTRKVKATRSPCTKTWLSKSGTVATRHSGNGPASQDHALNSSVTREDTAPTIQQRMDSHDSAPCLAPAKVATPFRNVSLVRVACASLHPADRRNVRTTGEARPSTPLTKFVYAGLAGDVRVNFHDGEFNVSSEYVPLALHQVELGTFDIDHHRALGDPISLHEVGQRDGGNLDEFTTSSLRARCGDTSPVDVDFRRSLVAQRPVQHAEAGRVESPLLLDDIEQLRIRFDDPMLFRVLQMFVRDAGNHS